MAAVPDWTFDASSNLRAVIAFIEKFDASDLARAGGVAAFDIFCGKAAITKRWRNNGYACNKFDKECGGDEHDILRESGFYAALLYLLQVLPFGLMIGGPPCSLWIFLSASVHGRTKGDASGNVANESVRLANLLVNNYCVLLAIAHLRKVYTITEQPSSSKMPYYLPFARLISGCEMRRIFTWMGCFSHPMPSAQLRWKFRVASRQVFQRSAVFQTRWLLRVIHTLLLGLWGHLISNPEAKTHCAVQHSAVFVPALSAVGEI